MWSCGAHWRQELDRITPDLIFSNDNIIWTSAVSVVEKVAMTSAMFEQAFSIIIYSISYSANCNGEPWSVVICRRWTHAWTPPRAQGSRSSVLPSFQHPSARLRVRNALGRGCPGLSAEQLVTPLPHAWTPPHAQGSRSSVLPSFQRPSARLRVRIAPGRGCPGLSAEQLATPLPPRFTVQRE